MKKFLVFFIGIFFIANTQLYADTTKLMEQPVEEVVKAVKVFAEEEIPVFQVSMLTLIDKKLVILDPEAERIIRNRIEGLVSLYQGVIIDDCEKILYWLPDSISNKKDIVIFLINLVENLSAFKNEYETLILELQKEMKNKDKRDAVDILFAKVTRSPFYLQTVLFAKIQKYFSDNF